MLQFQYSHLNHFKFGYQSGCWFEPRSSAEQIFEAQYGPVSEPAADWRVANRQAALQIRKVYAQSKLVICLSGGTDSEACVRAFREAEVDFSVAILQFRNDINDADVSTALKLCRELRLKPQIFSLNVLEFWESKALYEITDPIFCVSPVIACQLWLAAQVDGVPIIAQGEPHFKKEIPSDYVPGVSPYPDSAWYLVESERLCSMYSFFIQRGIPAIPGFFQFLPEQLQSFLSPNPLFKKLIANQIIGKLGTRTSKNEIIRQFYPEIESRSKLTGVENIQDQHDLKRAELAKRYPHHDQSCRISIPELKRQLGVIK